MIRYSKNVEIAYSKMEITSSHLISYSSPASHGPRGHADRHVARPPPPPAPPLPGGAGRRRPPFRRRHLRLLLLHRPVRLYLRHRSGGRGHPSGPRGGRVPRRSGRAAETAASPRGARAVGPAQVRRPRSGRRSHRRRRIRHLRCDPPSLVAISHPVAVLLLCRFGLGFDLAWPFARLTCAVCSCLLACSVFAAGGRGEDAGVQEEEQPGAARP